MTRSDSFLRLTSIETFLLFAGAACVTIAIAVTLSGQPSDHAELLPAPTCELVDEDTCTETGRRLAATDLDAGTGRYFLVGFIRDISEAERAFASVGIRIVPSGCLCCDPLQMAYNVSVRDWLRERHPGFVMPFAIY